MNLGRRISLIERLRESWRIKNLIDIIIMGKGVNYHQTIEYKEDQKYITFKDQKYNIDLRSAFMKQSNIFSRLRDRIKRQNRFFSLYYLENKKSPIALDQQVQPKLTSEVLDIAKRSTALSKALSELFRGQISGRTIIFIIIAGVVIFLVYLVMTGGITIPADWLPI